MYAYYAGVGQPYILSTTPVADAEEQRLELILGVGIGQEYFVFSDPDGLPPSGEKDNFTREVKLHGMFPEQIALLAGDPPTNATLVLYQTYNPITGKTKTHSTRAITSLKVKGKGKRGWTPAAGIGVVGWKPEMLQLQKNPSVPQNTAPTPQSAESLWNRVKATLTGQNKPSVPLDPNNKRGTRTELVS